MFDQKARTAGARRMLLTSAGAALALALSQQSAHANAYDVTFTAGNVSGTAVLTTDGTVSGGLSLNFAQGTITDTDISANPLTITGFSNYAYADQVLYPAGGAPLSGTQLSDGGVSFATASQGAFNIYGLPGGAGYRTFVQQFGPTNSSGAPGAYILSSFTLTQHPTVDTAQPSYDQNSAPLTQSTVVFEGGTFTPTTGVILSAPVILNYQGGTIDANNGSVYLTGNISGPGGLTAAGGNVILSGSNTYTGGTTIIDSGATLQLGAGGTTGSVAGDITDNGLLKFDYSGSVTADNALSGGGSVEIAAGTLVYTGQGTVGGSVTIDPGATLQWGDGSSVVLTNSSAAVTDNGTLAINYGVAGTGGDFKISGSGGLHIESGSFTLSAVTTYTGATTIDAGATLLLYHGGSIADSGDPLVNGTFDISGTTSGASIVSLSGSGSVLLGSRTLTLTGASDTFSGVITDVGGYGGYGGALTLAAGTETLTGANTYTGATTIDSGATLQLGAGGTTGSVAGSITDNGLLKFNYSGPVTAANAISGGGSVEIVAGTLVYTGQSTVDGSVTIDPGATLQWGNGSTAQLASSSGAIIDNGTLAIDTNGHTNAVLTISGSGGLHIEDAVPFYLQAANTYTGVTTIDLGSSLLLTGSGSISNSSDVVVHGLLDFEGTAAVTSIVSLSGDGQVSLGSRTLTLTAAAGVFSGNIGHNGSAGLIIAGGTETLTNGNAYIGATTIDIGAGLVLSGGGEIPNSLDALVNGTFDISGTTAGTSVVSLSGSGSVLLGSKTLTLTAAADTFSGVIADGGLAGGAGGSLEIAGGTEVLSGTNTYTGGTTIDLGATLQLGAGGATGSVAGNVVDNGALRFDYTGYGPIYGGVISGGGSLTTVSGLTQLTANNTYTGGTTIDNGSVLILGNGGATGSVAGNVNAQGGTLYFDRSNTVTFGGVYSGAGNLVQEGAGTLILTGANTSTGVTAIIAGTLQLGNGGNSGSVAGNIQDGSLLVFDHSNAITYSGVISNSGPNAGALTQAGSNILTLTGTNTFTGTTTINGGSILAFGNGASATGTVASASIVDNGAMVVNLAGTWQYAGVISGAGGLTVDEGTLILTGTNTYTGGTAINGVASLYLGDGPSTGSIVGDVSDNGALIFAHSTPFTFANNVSGSGEIYQQHSTTTLTGTETNTGGTFVQGGVLQIGNGTTVGSIVGNATAFSGGTLAFDHSDTVTFNGVIAGAGNLSQIGTGTLILNGDNTLTGLTTVSAGTLEVGDAAHAGAVLDAHIGGVTVGAAGTLAGHGTILGAVTNTAGGVVSPGGTIGTLTVGSYTQGANSTLAIEVSPTAASLLNVTGAANLNGTLALNFDAGTYGPHIYEIVAGGPVSGTFSTVTTASAPAGMAFGLDYTGSQIDLVAAPTAPAQIYGAVSSATLDRAQGFAGLVEDRFGDAGCVDGPDAKTPAACTGANAWAQALTATDWTAASSSGFSASNSGSGFLGGIDQRWANGATAGVAFGYEQNDLTMNAAAAKASGAAYYGALYGRWVAGRAWFDGQAFYMHSDWSVNRQVAGFTAANANPDGATAGFLFQVSTPLAGGDVRPYARITYASFNRDGVQEGGADGFGYRVASAEATSALGEFGVLLSHDYAGQNGMSLRPALQLGVQDDVAGRARDIQASLAGLAGSGFSVTSAEAPQVAGLVDASLKATLGSRFELTGDLRGRFSNSTTEASATLGGVFRF